MYLGPFLGPLFLEPPHLRDTCKMGPKSWTFGHVRLVDKCCPKDSASNRGAWAGGKGCRVQLPPRPKLLFCSDDRAPLMPTGTPLPRAGLQARFWILPLGEPEESDPGLAKDGNLHFRLELAQEVLATAPHQGPVEFVATTLYLRRAKYLNIMT